MARSGDPVSWKVVESGWRVVSSDGRGNGRVDEVVGDADADIFTGLKVLTGLLGKPKYVPSEQVAEITDGSISLMLTEDAAQSLRDWDETPAT